MRELTLGLRALRREWRAGELRILALALVVAVAAVASVGLFADRVHRALEQRAVDLLAADLVVVSGSSPEPAWRAAATARGLRTSEEMVFNSVATGPGRPQLVEVKAVGANYPLRGTLRTAPRAFAPDSPAVSPPQRGTVWVEPRLLNLLGERVGDTLGLGRSRFRIARVLTYEPDRATGFFGIAPRVMMRREDVATTGLIQPGSRVHYRLLLAGTPAALRAYRAWLTPQLAPGQRFEDVRDARPQLRLALDRAGRFLALAALVSVLLSGVAVATAARRHVERQTDAAAVLRCLGASQGTVLRVYAVKLVALGLGASLVGCAVGYLGQAAIARLLGGLLADQLPPPAVTPAVYGLGVGLVTLLGFALPPILRLRRVPPLRVLRRDLGPPPLSAWSLYGLGSVALLALMMWMAGEVRLALWLAAGTAATLLVLGLGAAALVWALRPLRRHVGVALRFGLAGIARRRGDSIVQVLAFGLGLMALLLLSVIRSDLLDAWQRRVPPDAPNYFFINIQPTQVPALQQWFASRGLPGVGFYPMVRARLLAIDGRPLAQWDFPDEHGRRHAAHAFNLSWAATPQVDNRIVAGRWWDPAARGEHSLSVAQRMAKELGLRVGDTLRFRVGDQPITLRVTSVRAVEWDNFRVNFFMVVPPGVLEGFPATYVTSVHLPPARQDLLRELVQAFPSVTVIDVAAVLRQVRAVIAQVVRAVEFVFLFTLAAGLVVLYAALQSSLEERIREAAVLRALGARRRQLRLGLLGEFATLGLLAGVLAAGAATGVGWVLAEHVLNLTYRPDPLLLLGGALIGAFGVGLAGWFGTGVVLRQPPLAVLRSG